MVTVAAIGQHPIPPMAYPAVQCYDGGESHGRTGMGSGRRKEALVFVLRKCIIFRLVPVHYLIHSLKLQKRY